MSGTYQLDGELFTKNPLAKRWQRRKIAADGVGQPIFTSFWQLELSFGTLETQSDVDFFEGKFLAGGLVSAVLPHPKTGNLTGFTGVAIEEFSYEYNDVEADSWAESARMLLGHINLAATGTA